MKLKPLISKYSRFKQPTNISLKITTISQTFDPKYSNYKHLLALLVCLKFVKENQLFFYLDNKKLSTFISLP